MTPVQLELETDLQFIVVEVSVSSKNERHLYKVYFGRGKAVAIKKSDLDRFIPGNDYHCIHITVNSLKRLDVIQSIYVTVHANHTSLNTIAHKLKTIVLYISYIKKINK